MSPPLFVFFGAESEYVLNPIFVEMQNRGYDCVELHATPDVSVTAGLKDVLASQSPKVLVTSAHFGWDERYMFHQMGIPDCPALVELIALIDPVYLVYYPHDLSQPLLTGEVSNLPLVDLYLAPSALEHMFKGLTEVQTVGWIKAPHDLLEPQERWGRRLWLTMSLEYILVEHGTTKTMGLIHDWIQKWLWIKFPPYPQFEEMENHLRARGINLVDRNTYPTVAARHFDFVVTNGESSVVRESAMMGVETFIVTEIGLFGDKSRRNMWQFADLENVHVVANFEAIPDIVENQPPRMQPFDMDSTIDAIVSGARRKTSAKA